MKIAFINQSYPPMISGAAIVVQKLAEGIASRGHSTLVVTASDSGRNYMEVLGNNKIIRLRSIHNPKRVDQKFVLWSGQKIYKEIKEFNPDIIHIHDVLSMGIESVHASHTLDIPMIATIHQLPWFVTTYLPTIPGIQSFIERNLWSYSRWLNKQCKKMVVPTPTIAREIKERGGFITQVISNGVDLDHFKPESSNPLEEKVLRQKYNIEPNCPIILHVGRLDIDKNVADVIEAAAVAIKRTDAFLVVVGDGERRNQLTELSKKLDIQARCKFLGFIDHNNDLPGLYRMSSVFITASEIETQGIVLLEALASGLPVVAVNATCIPDIIKHEVNGYLTSPNNVNYLGDYIMTLIKNPAKGQQMGEMGRKIVQNHSQEVTLDKYEELYKNTIKSSMENEKIVDSIPVL
jgi:glycosyltransferase involved in cell wall biosynthesis